MELMNVAHDQLTRTCVLGATSFKEVVNKLLKVGVVIARKVKIIDIKVKVLIDITTKKVNDVLALDVFKEA